jgi:hypothetical protein
VTLALGTPGTVAAPTTIDSSNCGGFNDERTLILPAQGTITFQAFNDVYTVTGADNVGGETMSFRPVPVPQNVAGAPTGKFYGGSLFSTDICDSYTDLSATGNPVCSEFHLSCTAGSDCNTFSYKVTTNYAQLDQGTPHFLKASGVDCLPPDGFDENIFTSYTVDPLKGGGGGTGSCFAATYSNSGVQQNNDVSISVYTSGFFPAANVQNPPIVNDGKNAGNSSIPLVFKAFDATSNALITPNSSNSLCFPPNPCTPTQIPVSVQFVSIGCGLFVDNAQVNTATSTSGGSGVQFNTGGTFPNTWQVNVKTSKTFTGNNACQVLELILGSPGGVQSTHSTFWKFK